jgi:DNA-binding XRE family transcriptional regulator
MKKPSLKYRVEVDMKEMIKKFHEAHIAADNFGKALEVLKEDIKIGIRIVPIKEKKWWQFWIRDRIEKEIFKPISYIQKRIALGLTLRQVAKQTGISPSTISRIERNDTSKHKMIMYKTLNDFYNKQEYGK